MRRLLLALVAVACLAPAEAAAAGPVSSHAMVHSCCMPSALQERIFAESKALGASYIRVDLHMGSIFERDGAPAPAPDWRRFDHVLELSRRYGLPVLGIVLGTPSYLSACPERPSASDRCGARDPQEYGRLVGEMAARGQGAVDHWEIINEPDGAWAFEGTPEEYARMLSASHDAIKARAPRAKVVMGGVMTPWDSGWANRVFATEGAGAASKFDIANVHLRGKAADLPRHLSRWRDMLATHGFRGPAWVTEHGYAADPAKQNDPAFVGGEAAQAAYLTRSLLGLADAGAGQIFVTLRDVEDPEYASEGLVNIGLGAPFAARRKPAFDAVRRFGERWPELASWLALRRKHEAQAIAADGLAREAESRRRALARTRATTKRALRLATLRLERTRARARRCRRTGKRCASLLRARADRARRVRKLRRTLASLDRQSKVQLATRTAQNLQLWLNWAQALEYKRRVES